MANKPLPYRPAAVPTPLGWAHEKTGEQLTSARNLEPAEGTDDYKPNNRKWMAAYNDVPLAAPTIITDPTVSGTPVVGSVLTGVNGTWAGNPTPTFTYGWTRDDVEIPGATELTYTLVTADAGALVAFQVTATNSQGVEITGIEIDTLIAQVPANTAVPVVTGTTALGDTLTASNGTWTGTPAPTFTRQWTRGGVNIAGATNATYVITAADQGTTVAVKVTGTNTAGNATATSAGTAVPAA